MFQINPRAYEQPNKVGRCPVICYRRYAELRPSNYSNDDDPFYIAVKKQQPQRDCDWFKRQPIGANNISSFASSMVKAANIQDGRKLTNTSYRKHLAARLNEGCVPKEVGRLVTGHKRPTSLDSYAPISTKQQRILSDIVGGEDVDFNAPAKSATSIPPLPTVTIAPPTPAVCVPSPTTVTNTSSAIHSVTLPSSGQSLPHFFQGANITGPVHIHIHQHTAANKRRNLITSDSDSD